MEKELYEALKRVMYECGYEPNECFDDSTYGKAYAAIAKYESQQSKAGKGQ